MPHPPKALAAIAIGVAGEFRGRRVPICVVDGLGVIVACHDLAEAFFPAPGATDALPALCRRFHVSRLDLFGSAATGRVRPRAQRPRLSCGFPGPLPPAAYAEAYFGLREALETLSGRPVDLVTEAALENPSLRQRVEAERRALFRSR